MDAFTAQAWKMILTPAVRDAFDLSKGIRQDEGALRQGLGRPVVPCSRGVWSRRAADS